MSTSTSRPLLAGLLSCVPLVAVVGCGSPGGDGTNVSVIASPISHQTLVPFFSMGHDLELMPYGGIGVLRTGAVWTAEIEFVDVPEGKYVPRYDGYGVITQNITGIGGVQAYCEIEWGLDIDRLAVTSGGRNQAEIDLSGISGCDHIGFDRFITDPSYTFDPQHRWAGATNGENIVRVTVDDLEPFTDVEFQVCDESVGQECEASPFGIFPDLPDPPDTAWPDPEDWETESMLITTESHGDLEAFLVVKPGMIPTYWEVRFEDEESNVEAVWLRVSNLNNITITAP